MTKKKTISWRLKELPDGHDVALLVQQEVITKEEARQILLNEGEEDSDKLKAKDEEIKFLRDLVDTLAAKHNGYTTIYHEYSRLRHSYPVWYGNYQPLMQTYSSKTFGPTMTTGTISMGATTNAMNLVGAQNVGVRGLSTLN